MGNTQSIPAFSILSLGAKSRAESPCPIMRCCLKARVDELKNSTGRVVRVMFQDEAGFGRIKEALIKSARAGGEGF